MKRFFHPGLGACGPAEGLRLADDEAHHLRDVLRVATGEVIELFDGSGGAAPAIVESITRREVLVRLSAPPSREPPSRPEVWLAVASPKADRLRWLVEKAVELEVDRLLPLETERSIVHPGEGKRQRLQEAVLQACKQCGRNRCLAIEPAVDWEQFLTQLNGDALRAGTLALLADQHGRPLADVLQSSTPANVERVVVAIGPEGGFSPAERERGVAAGLHVVAFGRRILRIETAALAAAATVRSLWPAPVDPQGE